MALKVRLRKQGRTNRQTFRLVVTDIRNPRDGKYLETLGSYNPFQKENNFKINTERLNYWLGLGAEISENAQKLIATTAPDLIKNLHAKEHAKRTKKAAKRRALKQKKKAGVKTEKPKAEKVAAPKKAKAPVKRAKKAAAE